MKAINTSKKAFTLMEIVVVIGILFIIVSMVFPLFNSNMKSFSDTAIKDDLQKQAQYAIKVFTDKAMEAEAITKIEDENSLNLIDNNKATNINNIIFITDEIIDIKTGEKNKYNFNIKDHSIFYTKNNGIEKNITNNIDSVDVQALNGTSFKEAKGIKIKINMKKEEIKYSIDTEVYFRNSNE